MKVRSILFALLVPAAACGGDRETRSVTATPADFLPKPVVVSEPVVAPEMPAPEPVKVVEIVAPMPTKYDELIARGKELVGKGSFGDAKEMFVAASQLSPKAAEPHIELARMYIAMNERGLAIKSANKAVKLAPVSSQAWNTLGRAELARHDYEAAILAFTQAVEHNPDNAFAWNNLGYTELLLKRYDDAAEHLIEATSRKDAAGYMFNNLGTALEHLDRLDEARMAYDAGGKLGSKEAASSRKRLEGVKSIAVAKVEPAEGRVHDEVRADGKSAVKEYELTDEGDAIEGGTVEGGESKTEEVDGSQASEELEAVTTTPPTT